MILFVVYIKKYEKRYYHVDDNDSNHDKDHDNDKGNDKDIADGSVMMTSMGRSPQIHQLIDNHHHHR